MKMENLGEYDKITQTIEISEDVINQVRIGGKGLQFRRAVLSELVRKIAEKLIESGYVTETWLKREHSEEFTATLYVKPLIEKD